MTHGNEAIVRFQGTFLGALETPAGIVQPTADFASAVAEPAATAEVPA